MFCWTGAYPQTQPQQPYPVQQVYPGAYPTQDITPAMQGYPAQLQPPAYDAHKFVQPQAMPAVPMMQPVPMTQPVVQPVPPQATGNVQVNMLNLPVTCIAIQLSSYHICYILSSGTRELELKNVCTEIHNVS